MFVIQHTILLVQDLDLLGESASQHQFVVDLVPDTKIISDSHVWGWARDQNRPSCYCRQFGTGELGQGVVCNAIDRACDLIA